MKTKKRVYTHVSVDIDAVSSLWLLSRFLVPREEIEIVFVPANWNGDGFEAGDMAVDIEAGGRGIKGERDKNGFIHSSFASLLKRIKDQRARKILKNLASMIDQHDAFGQVKRGKSISSFIGLTIVLNSLKSYHKNNDKVVVSRMFEILDGLYQVSLSKNHFRENITNHLEVVGKTALLISDGQKNFPIRSLFNRGFEAVIYIDGYNMGLLVPAGQSVNQTELVEFIKKSGELDEWYFHPAGYMLARGTRKSPVITSSWVDPYELARKWEEIRKKI